jgi:signal transduction histidine kinase
MMELHLKDTGVDEQETMLPLVQIIRRASTQAMEMIRRLLVLSRREEASYRPTDLSLILEGVVRLCQASFPKSIEFRVTADGPGPLVRADPAQIEQVLLNLCINAMHAMTAMRQEGAPPGGIITAAIETLRADDGFAGTHPAALPGRYYAVIRLADTGVGMDEGTRGRIFEPFFTTKSGTEGTGLGLSIVHSIIQNHDGFIEVQSSPGTGSTFSIYLPELMPRKQNSSFSSAALPGTTVSPGSSFQG